MTAGADKMLKRAFPIWCRILAMGLSSLAVGGFLAGCNRSGTDKVQGYIEGEFVYVSSPYAGTLNALHVQRGDQITAGALLFNLEDAPERALRAGAQGQVAQSRANLEDARKGKRPTEIDSLDAQLKRSRAALVLAEKDLARQEKLARTPGATSQADVDKMNAFRDMEVQQVALHDSDLKTGYLGARSDQIVAAEALVDVNEATLAKAEWDLSQKAQNAPQSALVFDTLYREGEWVAAGRPVVCLLPPENVKVRAFVSAALVGAIHPGDRVKVTVDSVKDPFIGKVSFISPRAEYTPPVIYSLDNRSKLVFMVEAVFEREAAMKLHPGQPVDIQFGS